MTSNASPAIMGELVEPHEARCHIDNVDSDRNEGADQSRSGPEMFISERLPLPWNRRSCASVPFLVTRWRFRNDAVVPPFVTRHLHKCWTLLDFGNGAAFAMKCATAVRNNMSEEE